MLKVICIIFLSHVYDYCTNVNNQGGRGNSVSIPSAATSKAKKSQAAGGAQFVGHELYKRLKEYLKAHLVSVLKVYLQYKSIPCTGPRESCLLQIIFLFW